MIILRNKNFSIFGNLFKKKEKRKQVSEVDKQKLTNLLKTNPRQYLIEMYGLDTVIKRMGEFERTYGVKLPQDIYKYVEAIKSFAGPLKTWAKGKDDLDLNYILKTDNIIYRLDSGLSEKYDSVESYRKDMESDGEIVLMSNIEYDYFFIYNTRNNTWHVTYSNSDVDNLEDLVLPFLKHEIEDNKNYQDPNAIGNNGEYSKELRELWYQHLKSKL